MKFKFIKPFASFRMSNHYRYSSLKDDWRMALHDPAYLIISSGLIAFFIYIIIKSL